ncbi:MAG: hypothetical protein ACRDF0_09920, partial [Candidatus Limnocylindria bacterium]
MSAAVGSAVRIAALAAALLLAAPLPAAAVISGGCTATATASVSGGVDLTTAREWRLRNADVVSGMGQAPTEQSMVQIGAYAFGVSLPILATTGSGTGGSAGPYAVADYSRIARTAVVAGASDSCSGSIRIVVEDVAWYQTAAGLGGAAAAIIGLLGILGLATRPASAGGRLGGALAGLLGGLG